VTRDHAMTLHLAAEAPPLREQDGALRVGRTRVTLETVLWEFQQGATPEAIVERYPILELADVYDVVAYYLRHRDDVDAYLEAQEQTFRDVADEVLRAFPSRFTRADLERRVGR